MDAVFACPKCGYELKVDGLAAGREVRCGWCESRVEVPFLPRVAGPRRPRRPSRRMPRWLLAAWGAVGVLAVIVLTIAASRWTESRTRLIQDQRVNGLLGSAESDERAGRLGDAVAELEAALALLRAIEPPSSPRLATLSARRDALVRREVRAQLDGLAAAPAGDVLGVCLTLRARLEKRPGLADLESAVRGRLQAAAADSASAELGAARDALDAGRPAEALHHCERLAKLVKHLDDSARSRTEEEARALVTRIARAVGVVVEPITGHFTFGSPAAYTTALQPVVVAGLLRGGYVTCPSDSPWRPLWVSAAPFYLSVVVNEQWGEDYLQSRNRISLLNATLALKRGGTTLWEQLATAHTLVPIPRLPAYQAARLSVGDAPVREHERLLYDNAREVFADRFASALAALPQRATVALGPSTAADAPSGRSTP
jgi:DNA-directed RNA polymerase subunit RPC12/RpoP